MRHTVELPIVLLAFQWLQLRRVTAAHISGQLKNAEQMQRNHDAASTIQPVTANLLTKHSLSLRAPGMLWCQLNAREGEKWRHQQCELMEQQSRTVTNSASRFWHSIGKAQVTCHDFFVCC